MESARQIKFSSIIMLQRLLCITKLGHKCGKRCGENPCKLTKKKNNNYISSGKNSPCTNSHHSGVLGTVPWVGVYL